MAGQERDFFFGMGPRQEGKRSWVPLDRGHLGGHDNTAWPAYVDGSGRLAEFERDLIRVRTGEGRARAKARGVKLGRKPKLTPHQRKEAVARREAGEVLTETARSYNVSHSTIRRLQ